MPNWKKLILSGSDAELNSLNVTSTFTASGINYPPTDGDNGDTLITDGAGNLSFARTTVYANVKNVHGSELVKGMPVHVTGAAGNTSEVVAASASNAATMPAHFILNETLADDAEGLAIAVGYINQVNTGDFSEGDTVYVGADGGYTNVKPTGSNLIQNLGIVDKVDASNGSGFILGAGRSNDVPNITSGYAWVGNSDQVATAVATSSFVVNNANTASYVAVGNIDGTVGTVTEVTVGNGLDITDGTTTPNITLDLTEVGFAGGFNNKLITNDGDGTVTAESNLGFDGTTLDVNGKLDIDYSTTNTNTAVVEINNNTTTIMSTDHFALKVAGGEANGAPSGQQKSYGGYFTAGNTNGALPDSIALYAQGHEDGAPNSYAAIFSGSAGGVVGINTLEPTVELEVDGDGKFSGTLEIGGISDVSASIAASGGGSANMENTFSAPTSAGEFQNGARLAINTYGTSPAATAGTLVSFGNTNVAAVGAQSTAPAATGMITVVTDAGNTDELLIEGVVKMSTNTGWSTAKKGSPLYMDTTAGQVNNTAPSTAGEFVRVVGHVIDASNSTIYFNPSQDWIEL